MRKKLSIAAIAATAAITLAGCAGGGTETPAADEGPADIRVWLVGTDTPQEAPSKPTSEEV